MLKIRRVKIENFRQFRDVELKFDDDKGIFLFIGKNGIGKSNFLNAVCWCLYEKQPFKFHDEDKNLLNDEAAVNNHNERIIVEIEISMDGDVYLIKRYKTEIQDSVLVVMRKKEEDWIDIENPHIIINNFLPETVRDFFLFDGEAIQNLFKGDYSSNIKKSVWKVSDVELLDTSIEHLSHVNDFLRKKLSSNSPDVKKKEEEYENFKKSILNDESEVANKEKLVDKFKTELVTLKNKETQFAKYHTLHKERDDASEEHDNLKKQIAEYQSEINSLIVDQCPFFYLKDALKEISVIISKDVKKGEIPPAIKGKFVKDLISTGKCICGTHIRKGSTEYDELNKLLSHVSPMDGREVLLTDNYFVSSEFETFEKFPSKLKILREKRAKARENQNVLERKIKDIKEQLKNSPDKEVGSIEKTIQQLEGQIDAAQRDIGSLSRDIRVNTDTSDRLRKEIDDINSKKEQNKLLTKQYNLTTKSLEKLNVTRTKLVERTRKIISSKTDEYFKDLIWKKGEFEKIYFNDNYELSVHKTGQDNVSSLRDLSTGEMKVLGFATLKALAEISGFNIVPAFIDGPLEYLDEGVQEEFLKQLPGFMPDKQVFVFSVDRKSILEFGKKSVKSENFYQICRYENSLSTHIIKYV